MKFLVPYFVFVLSYNPIMVTPDAQLHKDFLNNQIIVGAEIGDLLIVEGEIKTDMQYTDLISYSPFQSEYFFRAALKYKGFSLGIEHACFHPIKTYNDVFQYEGGYERIYFKFDSREFE